jgi:uncharacterized protein (TIGR00251 family)
VRAEPSPVAPHRDGASLEVRVQPRAARAEVGAVEQGALRVRISAPPVEGAANAALIELLAKHLAVRKADIAIISGERGRTKRLLVRGVSADELLERLQPVARDEPESR